jgi:tetratricopeptide (TPR) repeat protein
VSWVGRIALCTAGVVVISAFSLPRCVRANVQSEALYARGLIPFNSGKWDEAYRFFDQAVQADSTDAVALYYRGLTQARRGALAAAVQDMQQALKLNPALPHAALDLGIAYFDGGQYVQARSWLERAYQQGSERLTAAFFLGMTLYRLGDDRGAQQYLNEAAADPELRASARYYAGLSMLRQGHVEAGRSALAEVAREQPQSEVGKAAERYLSGAPAARQKPWSVFGELGFQYDSNVNAGPSNSDLNVPTGESDGSTVLAAGGNYTLLDTGAASVRAHYDFYQSIHFKLTEFDLQGHRFRGDVESTAGPVNYGFAATYDLYLLDYQTFFQEGFGTPWVAFAEGPQAATQVYYTLRARDFFRSPYGPYRDGVNNAGGIRQYVQLGDPERVLGFGYQFDAENTAGGAGGNDFQYKGQQVDLGVRFPFQNLLRVQLAYLFRLENYQFPNSRTDFTLRRHDHEHQFVVALAHDLTSNVALTLDYLGVFNGSNISDFDYDRNIVGIGVQVVF